MLPIAVAACLDRYAVAGQRLIAALSGGVDSVALLHCLNRLAPARRLGIAALHVNHGLSPNAESWEAHCHDLCVAWGIPLLIERVTVERGSSDGLEAAARRVRHAAFERADGDWVVLGHHCDDQAETLLFNLLRGTGLRGAAAMGVRRGRLLRPLLGVCRADILDYAQAVGLRWIDDESNDDTRYSRNHLRHEVLDGLERRFPGSTTNLAAAAQRFGEALNLLDDLAAIDLGQASHDFPLAIATLVALPEARARNILRYLLQRRHVGIPSEERLREAVRQLLHAAPDRHPAIVFGSHRLVRKQREIHLETVQSP